MNSLELSESGCSSPLENCNMETISVSDVADVINQSPSSCGEYDSCGADSSQDVADSDAANSKSSGFKDSNGKNELQDQTANCSIELAEKLADNVSGFDEHCNSKNVLQGQTANCRSELADNISSDRFLSKDTTMNDLTGKNATNYKYSNSDSKSNLLVSCSPKSAEPLMCHVCGKKFTSGRTLRVHLNWYNGVHFVCLLCGQTFLSKKVQEIHMRNHLYDCALCETRFEQRQEAFRHIGEVHRVPYPYECQLCGKKNVNLSDYDMHIWKHSKHNVANDHECKITIRCRICGLYFPASVVYIHEKECNAAEMKFEEKHKIVASISQGKKGTAMKLKDAKLRTVTLRLQGKKCSAMKLGGEKRRTAAFKLQGKERTATELKLQGGKYRTIELKLQGIKRSATALKLQGEKRRTAAIISHGKKLATRAKKLLRGKHTRKTIKLPVKKHIRKAMKSQGKDNFTMITSDNGSLFCREAKSIKPAASVSDVEPVINYEAIKTAALKTACIICISQRGDSKEHGTSLLLQKHVRNVHWKDHAINECPICELVFFRFKAFWAHVTKAVPDCVKADNDTLAGRSVEINTAQDETNQAKYVHARRPRCCLCNCNSQVRYKKTLPKLQVLYNHIEEKHVKPNQCNVCDLCGEKFSKVSKFCLHIVDHCRKRKLTREEHKQMCKKRRLEAAELRKINKKSAQSHEVSQLVPNMDTLKNKDGILDAVIVKCNLSKNDFDCDTDKKLFDFGTNSYQNIQFPLVDSQGLDMSYNEIIPVAEEEEKEQVGLTVPKVEDQINAFGVSFPENENAMVGYDEIPNPLNLGEVAHCIPKEEEEEDLSVCSSILENDSRTFQMPSAAILVSGNNVPPCSQSTDKPFKCFICEDNFASQGEILEHIKIHNEEDIGIKTETP